MNMKTTWNADNVLKAAVCVLCLMFLLSAAWAYQEKNSKSMKNPKVELIPSLEGKDLFHAYCSTCHGDNGKGDGPVASFLDPKPTDQTIIAKRNGGVFTAKRVRSIIAGEDVIKAHRTRDMPTWEPIFRQKDKGRDLGKIRLENLSTYIQSWQEK